jgi:hypothetical protein
LNLNIYSTLTLLQAVDKIMPVNTFLRDTFFPGEDTFVTEQVLVDFRKGQRKMAPFIAPRSKGMTIEREGYRTDTYAPPKVAPQRPITTDDLMIRGMGESVFSQRTPADRQVELLAKDMRDQTDMITRREEWMAAQVLCGGNVTMHGYADRENTNVEISNFNYDFTNTSALVGLNCWGNSGAEVYQNIHDNRIQTMQKGGKAPTLCILGDTAYINFINDPDVYKKMNMYHSEIIRNQPELKYDNLSYVASVPGLGMEIYTYSDWYLDEETGLLMPFVPLNGMILGRPGMGGFRYGAVTQLEAGQFVTIEGKRVPKSWADEDADTRMLRITSRPVIVPTDVDDWYYGTVC